MFAMYNSYNEAEKTVFVGNLDSSVREEILFELFLQAGPLTKVTIAKDKDGRQRSYGFVCYKHREAVPYAIALLNGICLYGRPIKLQYRLGSSHNAEAHAVFPVLENGPGKPSQESYRTVCCQKASVFPSSAVSTCLSQENLCWQNPMFCSPIQPYSMDAQIAQQQSYLPDAFSQQSRMTSMSWFVQSCPASSSFVQWTHAQQDQQDQLSEFLSYSWVREGQVVDTWDTDQKERRTKKTQDGKQEFRKHKSKHKI
ncbi:splicing regulator RBM11 [Lepisosteus oculatus]|uniref:splicing regulator RBM11 n=1 Tax=Lepisosteus oculatus TaxID=7918 RepID=UPI003715444C